MTAQDKISAFYNLDPLDAEILPITHAEWIKCMDEYASQAVQEYKEKLKKVITLEAKTVDPIHGVAYYSMLRKIDQV